MTYIPFLNQIYSVIKENIGLYNGHNMKKYLPKNLVWNIDYALISSNLECSVFLYSW